MVKQEWRIIPLLGEPYVLEILRSLNEEPKRYTDLADVCQNEVTRTDRLRKMEAAGLVETLTRKLDKRTFVHYRLTPKGKAVFEEALKIEGI